MKFAHNGYYIEKYIKCDNCGVLIYSGERKSAVPELADEVFCSSWCSEWREAKRQGIDSPKIEKDFSS